MKNKFTSGISVIEVTISLGILSIISTASVWLIFTSLSLRDQALATTRTNESLRVLFHTLRSSIQKASVVSGSSNSLLLTSASECHSFVYDQTAQNLRYARSTIPGCAPDPNPSTLFFPPTVKLTASTFSVTPLVTGGRQVNVSGTIQTILPFNNYLTSYNETFTNLID